MEMIIQAAQQPTKRVDEQGAHTGEIRYSNYLKILQQIPSISHHFRGYHHTITAPHHDQLFIDT